MSTAFTVQRRRFVGGLVTTLVGGASGGCRDRGSAEDEHLRAVLRAYFGLEHLPGVRSLGEVDDDAEADESARARVLIEQATSVDDAVEALEAALLADFEAGQVRSVVGWQLAEIEAQLVGLVVAIGA